MYIHVYAAITLNGLLYEILHILAVAHVCSNIERIDQFSGGDHRGTINSLVRRGFSDICANNMCALTSEEKCNRSPNARRRTSHPGKIESAGTGSHQNHQYWAFMGLHGDLILQTPNGSLRPRTVWPSLHSFSASRNLSSEGVTRKISSEALPCLLNLVKQARSCRPR